MSDPFLAQVTIFAGNFNPRGWAYCNGALLSIAQNSALFSLLGTTYGGDGRVTFALPDLRGRTPRGSEGNSAGPGLPAVQLGQKGGAIQKQLTIAELPSHNHVVRPVCNTNNGTSGDPEGGASAAIDNGYLAPGAGEFMAPSDCANTGQGNSFDILNPFLGLNYIIATQGTFPSQN